MQLLVKFPHVTHQLKGLIGNIIQCLLSELSILLEQTRCGAAATFASRHSVLLRHVRVHQIDFSIGLGKDAKHLNIEFTVKFRSIFLIMLLMLWSKRLSEVLRTLTLNFTNLLNSPHALGNETSSSNDYQQVWSKFWWHHLPIGTSPSTSGRCVAIGWHVSVPSLASIVSMSLKFVEALNSRCAKSCPANVQAVMLRSWRARPSLCFAKPLKRVEVRSSTLAESLGSLVDVANTLHQAMVVFVFGSQGQIWSRLIICIA